MKSNNTIVAYIVEEKERCFYEWADTYDEWNDYYHIPTKENAPGSSHTFTGDNIIFKLTKTKHNGELKTRLVHEVFTSVESEFYIGERQKINTGRFKPMIKPFDSGLSYILDLSLKLHILLVIWSYNCNNIAKKKVVHLGSLIVQVFRSTHWYRAQAITSD